MPTRTRKKPVGLQCEDGSGKVYALQTRNPSIPLTLLKLILEPEGRPAKIPNQQAPDATANPHLEANERYQKFATRARFCAFESPHSSHSGTPSEQKTGS
jgi:hypothetical protein